MKKQDSASSAASVELSWQTVEKMDWQLWMLAFLLIFVLGMGLLSFMFPAVFWAGSRPAVRDPERAFFGFTVLLALVLVYLMQKQGKVRHLKRELLQAEAALANAERQAAIQSFETLPSTSQFRDTLAMEFRRAGSSHANLAVLLFTAPRMTMEALGRMTKLLRSMLRHGETLYRISDMAVGVIMPGMQLRDAASFAAQVETLCELPEKEVEVRIAAYPEEVSSLAEIEGKLRHNSEDIAANVRSAVAERIGRDSS